MKLIRILILCLIALLMTMSIVYAQVSFIVSSPKAGDSWETGKTKNIEWSYSSPQAVSQNWKLELMKGSTVVGTIADNVSGSSYSWRVGQYIGGNATPGKDYKIKISHVTQTQISFNSGVFSIIFIPIGTKIGPSKPSMTAEQKPELAKTKPKLEIRKPNLKCSVEAYYDSNCTQKIPFTGDSYQYDYQTAPSPKFMYFLIKIKNLGGPVNEPIYCMSGIFISSSRNYNTQGYLSGLGADEEIRMQPLSWRIEESDRGVTTIEAFMQISGKGYGEPHECYHGTTCTCHVEIK